MATPTIAPEVELPDVTKSPQVSEPKPLGPRHSTRDLLVEILEGHDEFLGWTPD